ncbi:MAG: hypothetical protein ABL925_09480, partial [Methylococcales bacterium]
RLINTMTSQTLINYLFFTYLCLFSNIAGADDDDLSTAPRRINKSAIYLDAKAQSQADIQTIALKASTRQTEFMATGKAISLQALLSLRNRYLLSLTEHAAANAKLKNSALTMQRLQHLYAHGVTAQRNLQAQQSQSQTEQAQVEASQIQSQALREEAYLNWGKPLTDSLFNRPDLKLNDFLSGRQTLLIITLPTGKSLPEAAQRIFVDASGNRSQAQTATLISSAPQPDSNLPGEHFFFQTAGKHIKPGMRISAWLPEQQQQTGVMIPKSALIWHMNQACVYVKTAADTFVRQALTDYKVSNEGYFVGSGLQADQQIVSNGAQLLLSEEIRGQIPDD